ncbi:MAG TPA: VWA domain-containing protein [Candidatus Limnocylindrales bacterium]|nr:VWA domain-containing protein [Candidatus Limnocylindrales bacterium]
MTTPRASRAWIDSRHLRESAGGAAALAGLDQLAPATRERLLERADRIATVSTSLAHAFLPRAVEAAAAGVPVYDAWEAALADVAGAGDVARELATAFFRIAPQGFAAWPEPRRRAWIDSVRALAESSRRLAASMLDATAAILDDGRTLDDASLAAWQHATEGLLSRGGWRSEFLAEAFVSGAALLAGRAEPAAFEHWATLVAVIGTTGRNPKPPSPPAQLLNLDASALTGVVRLCAAAAATHAKAAQRLLELIPPAISRLETRQRRSLLDSCARCRSLDALADAMALVGAVLHGIRAGDLDFLLAQAARIGEAAPAVLPAFLRTMDRAIDEGGQPGVELWVERGIELATHDQNIDAAAAHFRLETRTSHKLLVERSSAVTFEEIDGMLRRYLTMMSRRSFQLMPSPGIWMRPPLVAPEDVAIRLPERVDLFDAPEDNQALYKIVATHIAGRFEYGTYDFDLKALLERGWQPPLVPADDGEYPRDIIAFLGCFPNPLLASALFVLLDGVRIDACLARDFPGLRRELERMGRLYASTTVPAAHDRHDERLLETLFQIGLAHRSIAELDARLRAQGEFVMASIELLRSAEATVYDSASLAIAYYGGLAFAEARALDDSDETAFAEMGGATVIDPFEHLDGSDREENTAPWRPDPVRAEPGGEQAEVKLQLTDEETPAGGGRPVSLEELKSLLERGGDLKISEAHGQIEEGLGLYITDLLGKIPAEQLRELREKISTGDAAAIRAWLSRQATGNSFYYDEWDYRIADYRRRWCRVTEIACDEDTGEYFQQALARSGELVGQIKRDFQMLRPDQLRRVPRDEQGEEFDLNALVEAHSDRRGRRTPSDRLYVARKPEERDVATLFLVDMSASTDEPLPGESMAGPKRVIDLAKDTLAVLAQVLGEIGDSYAIYGFSGHGRQSVEIYPVKSFGERLSDKVKGRIGGIAPKRSTRMGAALRHAGEKLARTSARSRHLILLSDGFPQDFDYGDDRRSNTYGIRDTMQALREIEKRGMQTFCITVDPAGHDYLGEMCPSARYAVIEDIRQLPSELVRIYRRLTRH